MGDKLPEQSPEEIVRSGITWVGPSKSMPADDMNALKEAGLNVVPYTLSSSAESIELPEGVAGYFTDDPWTGR
ncbi:hypothetical protein DFO66_10410 [Brevibacterium sanguinis]|uniref:Glycerophosphoryl diester phosphodiesterase family protein n=2 Tax=Brevibacterium TaxID=1696 RepID=A0A366IIT4_9MICO|nr:MULTISPECIES: hypothetical protein [Brevibacterium]RBP65427.1 hypothetical protein DFO66_10410 [Brevibacterium sanguinis]RBP72061.1 hypothetical protein DFO65_10416 [Brevibacterium celere]